MILKASQRSRDAQLAIHLMESKNEYVALHEVMGFVEGDLADAFKEIHAISKGTRCKQYLFSLSLSPPETKDVPIAMFEDAIARVERQNDVTLKRAAQKIDDTDALPCPLLVLI